MGRKPKPDKLHALNGNPSRKKLDPEQLRTPISFPEMPDHLSPDAKQAWGKIVPILERRGYLDELDGIGLELLCVAYADWVASKKVTDTAGNILLKDKSRLETMYRNPYMEVKNKAHEQIAKLLEVFGLTPSSRSRMQPNDKPGGDDFDAFLRVAPGSNRSA